MRSEDQRCLLWALEGLALTVETERAHVLAGLEQLVVDGELEPLERDGAISYFDDARERLAVELALEQSRMVDFVDERGRVIGVARYFPEPPSDPLGIYPPELTVPRCRNCNAAEPSEPCSQCGSSAPCIYVAVPRP